MNRTDGFRETSDPRPGGLALGVLADIGKVLEMLNLRSCSATSRPGTGQAGEGKAERWDCGPGETAALGELPARRRDCHHPSFAGEKGTRSCSSPAFSPVSLAFTKARLSALPPGSLF